MPVSSSPLRWSSRLAPVAIAATVAALAWPAQAAPASPGVPRASVAAASSKAPKADAPQPVVLRVQNPTARQLRTLSSKYDLLEVRRGSDYFVLGDASTAKRLRAAGMSVAVERKLPRLSVRPGQVTATAENSAAAATYTTFYGGYHTVAAHEQHLADVAAQYPTLTSLVDYGDSWRKTKNKGGHDLYALCITKKATGDCARSTDAPKPRSVVYAGIHARELAPPEIAWNWIDYLVTNYGSDTTVTSLLDTTEIWVIPLANPDGRDIVQQGGNQPYYQRKNANNTRGNCSNPPTSSNQHGVDMNRNATWAWGGVGSSNSACAQTYRGTSASSEPETTAQQSLFNSLFKDRRGTTRSDAAPADTTGTFMSYHSYAGLILFPWGDTTSDAPNHAKLKALADKMAVHNNYRTGQGSDILYSTSGTTDDDLYGRLGVASFTTELGAEGTSCDGFMPAYSCVESRFWPQERLALIELAKAAAGPYR